MPTPSADPPPDPLSPAYSFSTCPDETLHAPSGGGESARTSGQRGGEAEFASNGSSPNSPDLSSGNRQLSGYEAHLNEVGTFDCPSRSHTASPKPQDNPASLMTPPPFPEDAPRNVPGATRLASAVPSAVSSSAARSDPIPDLDAAGASLDVDEDEMLDYTGLSSPYPIFPSTRVIPISPSSYLRPGSRFSGKQTSEKQTYDVFVEIKHVDLRESVLCGYLRITGLTEDHPTLTTFFEGEIIGPKFGFLTDSNKWGATNKVDSTHWSKFAAFKPFAKMMRKPKGNVHIQDPGQHQTIFMRWKEHFLVPDHRVKTITGASFEGFYYISFDQFEGVISGIYFHSKSEKFQELKLNHVPDRGCFGAFEFR